MGNSQQKEERNVSRSSSTSFNTLEQRSHSSIQSVTIIRQSSNTSARLHNASLSASTKPPQHTKTTNVSCSSSRSSNIPGLMSNSSVEPVKTSVQLHKTSVETPNRSVQSITILRQSSNTSARLHNASLSASTKPPQHTKTTNVSCSSSRSSNISGLMSNSSVEPVKTSVQLHKTSVETPNRSVQSVTTLRQSSNTSAQLHNASLSASTKPPQHTKTTNVSCSSSRSSNIPGLMSNSSVEPVKTSVETPNRSVQSVTTLRQSSNTSAQLHNASFSVAVKPPRPFTTEEEFFQNWSSWKSDFLIYKKILDESKPNVKWGNMLLNVMGPIGQQICNVFTFNSLNEKNDLDILLKKFDEYCTFASKEKLPDEDIYMYIRHLQLTISKANIKDEEELVKNKILKEIDERTFTNTAKVLMPWFKFSSDFNNLTFKEIAFIWQLYDGNFTESCHRCGNNHSDKKCPSLGKQCLKCNELNHSAKRCPTNFITNCHYCGDSHFKKRCPAYNEICTKCKKLHHFSWKCQSQISHCRFCGLTHGASRSLCPANNALCTTCKTRGHFAVKCNNHLHSRNH